MLRPLSSLWAFDGAYPRFIPASLCLLLAPVLLAASPSFVQAADSYARVVMASGSRALKAAKVAPVDMDQDGDSDAVVAAESGTLAWLENDGTHVAFTVHLIDTGTRVARALDVDPVDFDRDGDLDVVTAASDTVAWYENDGSHTSFTHHVIDSGTSVAGGRDFEVVDVDGDGDLDGVAAAGDTFAWYENDGTGMTFTRHIIDANPGGQARAVRPVDLDGDADQDVVAVTSGELLIYERKTFKNPNKSDRFKKRSISTGPEVANARDVEPVDVDGDGLLDVAVSASDTFVWFQNQGNNKTFTRHVIDTGPPVRGGRDAEPLDVDRDGDMDFITAASTAGVFAWYENEGSNTTFTRHVIEQGSHAAGARDVEPVDVDQDGDWDVMTAAAGADEFAWHASPNVFVVDDDGAADTGPVDCQAPTSAPAAVSAGLNRVTVGDTLWVCPGTYTENLSIPAGQSHLKLVSTGDSPGTILTAADTTAALIGATGADGVRVDGFTLRGGSVRLSGLRHGVVKDNRMDSLPRHQSHLELVDSDTNTVQGNRITDPGDTGILLDDADSNFVVNNRIVDNDFGLRLNGASDHNVVRDNRIDTHFTGIVITLSGSSNPGGRTVNRIQKNTIRRANTGILVYGIAGDSSIHTVVEQNNIASNFEGVENLTGRILDARDNWWGDATGPGGQSVALNMDPFTGILADGDGDSIVSENADGSINAPDTNVAFDPWLDTQAVDVEPLPDRAGGCLIQRTAPVSWTRRLRNLRDETLSSAGGRYLTTLYYEWFE